MECQNVLPDEVRCVVMCDNHPLAGVFVKARFHVVARNDYTAPIGPTDIDGTAVLPRDALLKWAELEVRFGSMDYRPIGEVFAGRVSLNMMGTKELKGAIAAHDLFGGRWYPPGYRKGLEEALRVVQTLDLRKCRVEVTMVPPCCEVLIRDESSMPRNSG